jgi:hypothetical protein
MSRRRWFQMLLAAAVALGMLVIARVLPAQGNSEEAFERVKEVQERHTEKLMAREGVVGTAVGHNDHGRQAVMVLLDRPGVGGIPQTLEGVPVRAVVVGQVYALATATARFPRPVPTGVSTGHPAITAGTIACRVKDRSGATYALSNNHVYANENQAGIGDSVLQPGRYDGGVDPTDAIGTLAAFSPLRFDGAANTIDAAIAKCPAANLGPGTPAGGYGVPKAVPLPPHVGMPVQKYGRTTGLTYGNIYALNATIKVGYSSGTALFTKQLIITPGTFSGAGDSGALVVTRSANNGHNARPVGLLFAGSGSYAIANPIGPVLAYFGVKIDGQ